MIVIVVFLLFHLLYACAWKFHYPFFVHNVATFMRQKRVYPIQATARPLYLRPHWQQTDLGHFERSRNILDRRPLRMTVHNSPTLSFVMQNTKSILSPLGPLLA